MEMREVVCCQTSDQAVKQRLGILAEESPEYEMDSGDVYSGAEWRKECN
jgi:hypothetical protein